MIVMKFGGTSIQDAESVNRVIKIIRDRLALHPVVVNSAMGKTTRNLLSIAQSAASGDHQSALSKLDSLIDYHHELADQVITNFQNSQISGQLQKFFDELHKLIEGISVLQDLTPRSQDKFLAYGELIATTIIAGALGSKGIKTEWLDARQFMITDDRFTQAHPILDIAYNNLNNIILTVLRRGAVPVIQGYIGSTREGATSTLGFEGSDYTAALVGAAIQADDVQIWKDVSGVMTADPAIYSHPYTVRKISFDEAAELTILGAKILHPCSIAPAQEKNIPVHVYNSQKPDAAGTELTSQSTISKNIVKSITYKKPVTVCRISATNIINAYDFSKFVFDALHQERISPIFTTTTDRNITLVLNGASNLQHLKDELGSKVQIRLNEGMATVSLIGQGLAGIENLGSVIMDQLSGIPVAMISQGASELSFTLVVQENDVRILINRLHPVFFKNLDKQYYI